MSKRVMRSDYMHWAKNQPPARFDLGSSEVPHYKLDRLPITIADLELDGASRHRYLPLRQAIGDTYGVAPDHVVTADGTSMANFLALAPLITPGDDVLLDHPVYQPLPHPPVFLGTRVHRFVRPPDDGSCFT